MGRQVSKEASRRPSNRPHAHMANCPLPGGISGGERADQRQAVDAAGAPRAAQYEEEQRPATPTPHVVKRAGLRRSVDLPENRPLTYLLQ